MNKLILVFFVLISGCTSTTLKTDSDITRKQLVILPEFMALSMANQGYQEAKQKAQENDQLNKDTYMLNEIRKISYRLIDEVRYFRDDATSWNWEINLQTSDQINAYCMPGGKIMVYTGLLDKAAKTNDEIAAVIGHEIAHALREHGRERMSTALIQQLGILGSIRPSSETILASLTFIFTDCFLPLLAVNFTKIALSYGLTKKSELLDR